METPKFLLNLQSMRSNSTLWLPRPLPRLGFVWPDDDPARRLKFSTRRLRSFPPCLPFLCWACQATTTSVTIAELQADVLLFHWQTVLDPSSACIPNSGLHWFDGAVAWCDQKYTTIAMQHLDFLLSKLLASRSSASPRCLDHRAHCLGQTYSNLSFIPRLFWNTNLVFISSLKPQNPFPHLAAPVQPLLVCSSLGRPRYLPPPPTAQTHRSDRRRRWRRASSASGPGGDRLFIQTPSLRGLGVGWKAKRIYDGCSLLACEALTFGPSGFNMFF